MKVLIRAVLTIGLILNIVINTPATMASMVIEHDKIIIITMDDMPYGW